MSPWLRLTALDYYWQRLKEWALAQDLDPQKMTKDQRGYEIGRLIDRANRLCEVDKIPGSYVRIDDESYARLVEHMREKRANSDG